MTKFSNPSKLSKAEQERLLIQFCGAVSQLKTPTEAARFIKDLLSAQEAEMLAKRLRIAELLLSGETYSQISFALKVAPGTVARVHEWLKLSGEGYRLVLERTSKEEDPLEESLEEKFDYFSWRNVKKRYPLYFWPQLLLENIIRVAKEKDRQKLRIILRKMDQKSVLYKQLNNLLAASSFGRGRRPHKK